MEIQLLIDDLIFITKISRKVSSLPFVLLEVLIQKFSDYGLA